MPPANESKILLPGIQDYLNTVGVRDREVLRRLREESALIEGGRFTVAQEAGHMIEFLIELLQAKRTLDVGTFTGYSALCAALAVGPDGHVVTLDKNAEWTKIAHSFWKDAGVQDRIELRLGLAIESLRSLLDEGHSETFDFAFIDADKRAYAEYFEACLKLVRRGGLIAIDNVLWRGTVAHADSPNTKQDTKAAFFREFNLKLHADERISIVVLPVADGLTLARKR